MVTHSNLCLFGKKSHFILDQNKEIAMNYHIYQKNVSMFTKQAKSVLFLDQGKVRKLEQGFSLNSSRHFDLGKMILDHWTI